MNGIRSWSSHSRGQRGRLGLGWILLCSELSAAADGVALVWLGCFTSSFQSFCPKKAAAWGDLSQETVTVFQLELNDHSCNEAFSLIQDMMGKG